MRNVAVNQLIMIIAAAHTMLAITRQCSAIVSSFVVIMPPSPEVIFLVGYREKVPVPIEPLCDHDMWRHGSGRHLDDQETVL